MYTPSWAPWVARCGKQSAWRSRKRGFYTWLGNTPWSRKWQFNPVFLPEKFRGQKSLAGYNPWGCKESDTTEHACTHYHISQYISDISIYSYSCICLSVEKITNTCCYSITKSCQLFGTPWIAACQASLSFNISLSLLKLMSSESVMTSTISSSVIPFSSCTQSCPASGSFAMSRPFASGGQSVGASASASVLPMNIQGWLPLGLTDLFAVQGPRNKLLAHMVYICSLWIVITNSFSNSNNLHNQYYQQHSKIYNMDNLGDIMLSEISQIQNDKNCIILHLCGIKKKSHS